MNKASNEELLFLPLGGAGEIGMNLNLYGYGGRWLMVDLGITFSDDSMPGVDVITPDIQFIADHVDDLEAIVLTHAHEDHLGAVHWLWEYLQVPVYASPFAAAVLKRKLAEADLLDDVDLRVFKAGDDITIGDFNLHFLNITHSIPEMNALTITTPLGTVLHTGDWKLDPDPVIGEPTDQAAFEARGNDGILAMVCDSTNVMVPGRSGSEGELLEGFIEQMEDFDGKILVTTFASNVARLETICKAAEAVDRHVCLVGRSLHRINEAARETGYLQNLRPFVNEEDAGHLPKDKVVYLCTGCQGEPRGAMSRIAFDDHRHVTVGRGDRVIFSSRVIPGNERTIVALQNQLVRMGAEVITAREANIHVSGHPARDELADMYRWIKPQIAVPVHGESVHITEHAKLAKSLQVPIAFSLENGCILKLAPGQPDVIGHAPAGRMAVDAGRLVPIDSTAIRMRKRLAWNGHVMVTLVLNDAGKLAAVPTIMMPGVIDGDDGDDFERDALDNITRAVNKLSAAAARDDRDVDLVARQAVRKLLRTLPGRRPAIDVQIIRVAAHAVAEPVKKKGKSK